MNDFFQSAVQFTPFFLMLGIMYVLVIRPQTKEREALEQMIAGLAKDDEVVTTSGLHGRIVKVGEATFEVEIAKGVVVRVERSAIARKAGAAGATAKG